MGFWVGLPKLCLTKRAGKDDSNCGVKGPSRRIECRPGRYGIIRAGSSNPRKGQLIMQEDIRPLVLRAFHMARQKGKPDWRRMNTSVLKNRLLQITNSTFSESAYGCSSMLDFVSKFPDILRLDDSAGHGVVELVDPGTGNAPVFPESKNSSAMRFIRDDLWTAMLDYASGSRYGWDPNANVARPIANGEELKRLPTFSSEDISELRKRFMSKHAELLPSDKFRVERWVAESLATNFLPKDLRQPWMAELITAVEGRLNDWFSRENIPPPFNLMRITERAQRQADPQLEELRNAVVDCVKAMTLEELLELKISAAVVARIHRKAHAGGY